MKYVIPLLAALLLCWAAAAQAAPADQPNGMGAMKNQPIEIEGGTSPRMTVIFAHKSHKDISCKNCHHETSGDTPYSSCREACHATPGARERDPMSMFMAFHAKGTSRSCYGCHNELAATDPAKYSSFKGCRPCHMSPQAREAAAKKK